MSIFDTLLTVHPAELIKLSIAHKEQTLHRIYFAMLSSAALVSRLRWQPAIVIVVLIVKAYVIILFGDMDLLRSTIVPDEK